MDKLEIFRAIGILLVFVGAVIYFAATLKQHQIKRQDHKDFCRKYNIEI